MRRRSPTPNELSKLKGALGPNNPFAPTPRRSPPPPEESYKKFSASQLYCGKCKQAVPVREKMLLVIPGGELYDYTCPTCGSLVGTRKTN